ncbi:MAG: hypothetical protein L6R42_011176 [Xanthoria sp. 1 TBL-2021]|nr:MAG: hypothetical protein L6R42_011176 [Xanthoria sp. 1 TBL-2021]
MIDASYGKEIDRTQVKYQRMVDAHQEELVAKRRQEIQEVRQKKERAANGEDGHVTKVTRQQEELAASVNGENGCAIEDTTSESESEIEIGMKIKTPKSDRTPTLLQSNPSTGPPTLTIPGSPKATKASIYNGVNLEQVNHILQHGDGGEQETSTDVVRVSSHVSLKTAWLDYLKSTAEYAKERAEAERVPGPGGSVNGYDTGPSAPGLQVRGC